MDQAPSSRFFQKGPPGWTRKTSSPPPVRRKRSKPAEIAIGRRIKKPPAASSRQRFRLPVSLHERLLPREVWPGLRRGRTVGIALRLLRRGGVVRQRWPERGPRL